MGVRVLRAGYWAAIGNLKGSDVGRLGVLSDWQLAATENLT